MSELMKINIYNNKMTLSLYIYRTANISDHDNIVSSFYAYIVFFFF